MGQTCKEVKSLIDSVPINQLQASLNESLRSHLLECRTCDSAVSATLAMGVFFNARREGAEEVSPSPFFESIVINALRARKAVAAPMVAFAQWWKATSSILAFSASISGILIVVALISSVKDDASIAPTYSNLYPPEAVMIDSTSGKDLTDEQVLQVVYNPRYEEKKK